MPSRNSSQFRWTLLLGVLVVWLLPGAARGADTLYVVKRDDTLYGIARAHGSSVSVLAERNGLSKNYQVRVGQRLVIPASKPPASAAKSPAVTASTDLPASVSDAIRIAPVKRGRWKNIVIHHSGVDEGTVKGMDRYHREVRHMEHGLAYHFVIGNGDGMRDGEVAVGQRWREQLDGGHLRSEAQNKTALGICLVGNFDKAAPTASQMKSLNALVKSLMKRTQLPASAVRTHQQINVISTRCPGTKFPTKSFLAGLKK
jgi:LysM repeat protein